MRWRWPPWRCGVEDHSAEVRERLAEVEKEEPEVRRLAEELAEIRRRNNFSLMVQRAIARAPKEGT